MSAAADTAAAVSEAAARARGGQVPILARHDATSTRLKELLGAPFLASPWLARLGRVSFLGTLDLHPGSVHASTRLDHSLGVAGVGQVWATSRRAQG